MNGHSRDQAKVSVHCRWPLVTGTDGQAGGGGGHFHKKGQITVKTF